MGRQCCCCHSLKSKVNDCRYGICVPTVTQPTGSVLKWEHNSLSEEPGQVGMCNSSEVVKESRMNPTERRPWCVAGCLSIIQTLGTRSIPISGFSDLGSLHRFYCRDYLKCILLQNPKIWGLGLWDSQRVLSLCFRNHVWANV